MMEMLMTSQSLCVVNNRFLSLSQSLIVVVVVVVDKVFCV